ncbi:MAG: hypothetical protein RSB90_11210 [Eubacterium sp.]
MKKRACSKLLNIANMMPELKHSTSEKVFEIKNSDVVRWLVKQQDIQQYIFNTVMNHEIIYDKDTGTWKGVDYHE